MRFTLRRWLCWYEEWAAPKLSNTEMRVLSNPDHYLFYLYLETNGWIKCNLDRISRTPFDWPLTLGSARSSAPFWRPLTPGGGKSSLPVILGLRALALGIADRICWVVPRDSLKKQAAEAFLEKRFRGLLGHSLEIREADNEPDPEPRIAWLLHDLPRPVGADPDLHRAEFFKRRYVLILDELHHVAEKSIWHEALGPMVERAAMVIGHERNPEPR